MHVSLKENRICIVGLSNQASGNHSIGTTCKVDRRAKRVKNSTG